MTRSSSIRRGGRWAATVAAVAGLVAFMPGAAQAQKIANPSVPTSKTFKLNIIGGFLGIGGGLAPFSLDFAEQGLSYPVLVGTVASDGAIEIPAANISFPSIVQPIDDPTIGKGTVVATLQATQPWTGRIDPLTGRMDLDAYFRVKASGTGAVSLATGGNCYLGSPGSPLHLTLRTHEGSFPSVATPKSVTFPNLPPFPALGYSDEAGRWLKTPTDTVPIPRPAGSVRLGDGAMPIPTSSGCTLGSTLDSTIGLPGTGQGLLDLAFVDNGAIRNGDDAIVQKGVKAKLAATGISTSTWPAEEVPEVLSAIPFTLDAGASVYPAGGPISPDPDAGKPFSWNVGGTFESATAATTKVVTFPTPGLQTVGVRLKDKDGDVDTRLRQVRVLQSSDIAVTSSVTGADLRGGSQGTFSVLVTNTSTERANTKPIVLTQSIPAGLTLVSYSAPGWTSCSNTATLITCTRPTGTLASEASSSIDVTVAASPTAASPVTAVSTVSQAGDPNPLNDTFSLVAPVRKTDLTVTLAHDAPTLTANGTYPYTLRVANVGDGVTAGTTTVIATLPTGMSYVAAGSGGSGWTCGPAPADPDRQVRCTRPPASTIAGNTEAPTVTLRVRVDRHVAAGTLTPSATVSTTAGEDTNAFGGANTSDDPSEIVIRPDLAISATHSGAFVVGDTGSYAITAENQSVDNAVGPTRVQADLPDGLTLHAPPVGGGQWDCTASTASRVDCVHAGDIAAETAAPTITVTVDVAHRAHGGVVLAASISNDTDGYAGNDTVQDPTDVHRVDVSVSLTSPKGFSVGQDGIYRVSVTNVGDADTVGDIVVREDLPITVSLKSVSGGLWDCSASSGQHIECVRPASTPLSAGSSAPLINVKVNVFDQAAADGQVVATATVDTARDTRGVEADEAVNGNNSSTLAVPAVSVDLAIQETHVNPWRVGTDNEISLKVVNIGSFDTVPGKPVTVVDALPAGLVPIANAVTVNRAGWACAVDDQEVTCTATPADALTSAVKIGGTVTIAIPVHVTDAAAEEADNVATISTEKDESVERSPNNRVVSGVSVRRVDLSVTGAQTIAPRAGSVGELTVQVRNAGTSVTIDPTVVTVGQPAGVTYRASGSTVSGWVCGQTGHLLTCRRTGAIAAGNDAPVLRLRSDVDQATAPDTWDSPVSVSTAAEPATRLADNEATVSTTLEKVDLALTKSHVPGGIAAGRRGAFTYKVQNVGNTASSGTIHLTDHLDPGYSDLRASGAGWTCTITGNDVDCTRTAPVAAGASAPELSVSFLVDVELISHHESSPIAQIHHVGDPYAANDKGPDPVEVVGTADLSLTRTGASSASVGDYVTVRYKVANKGTEATDGTPAARLHDTLSPGLTPVDFASSDAWDCDLAAGAVDCDLPTRLDPGKSSTVTVRLRVGIGAVPTAGAFARVRATPALDPNPDNDFAAALFAIGDQDLSLTAVAEDESVNSGDAGVYDVQVKNNGSIATTAPVHVKVPLIDGVTFHANDGSYGIGWDCRLLSGSRTVDCVLDRALDAGAESSLLKIALTPSPSNAPSAHLTFRVETDGDENAANDEVTLDQAVVDVTPPPVAPPVDPVTGSKLATLTDGRVTLNGLSDLAFEGGQLKLSGDIRPDGTWTVKQGGVHFDPIEVPVELPGSSGPPLTIKATLSSLADAVGHLPANGEDGPADLDLTVQLRVEAYLGTTALLGPNSNCTLGPVNFDMTGTYEAASKRITLASPDVSLPQAGLGCGNLGTTVNGILSLPSTGNSVEFHFTLGDEELQPPTTTTTTTTPTPPPPTQTVKTTTTVAEPAVAILGKPSTAVSSSGKLAVPVMCAGTVAQTCTGKVTVSAKSGKKTVIVGSSAYSVKGGSLKTVTPKLTAAGKKLWTKAGKKGLKTVVGLVPSGSTKTTTVRAVTLKAAKKVARKAAVSKK